MIWFKLTEPPVTSPNQNTSQKRKSLMPNVPSLILVIGHFNAFSDYTYSIPIPGSIINH